MLDVGNTLKNTTVYESMVSTSRKMPIAFFVVLEYNVQ